MKENRLTIFIDKPIEEVFKYSLESDNVPKWITSIKRLNGDYFVRYTFTEKNGGTEFEYFEWAEKELDGLMEIEALEKLKILIEEQ